MYKQYRKLLENVIQYRRCVHHKNTNEIFNTFLSRALPLVSFYLILKLKLNCHEPPEKACWVFTILVIVHCSFMSLQCYKCSTSDELYCSGSRMTLVLTTLGASNVFSVCRDCDRFFFSISVHVTVSCNNLFYMKAVKPFPSVILDMLCCTRGAASHSHNQDATSNFEKFKIQGSVILSV
jgi:hypothetical protein